MWFIVHKYYFNKPDFKKIFAVLWCGCWNNILFNYNIKHTKFDALHYGNYWGVEFVLNDYKWDDLKYFKIVI